MLAYFLEQQLVTSSRITSIHALHNYLLLQNIITKQKSLSTKCNTSTDYLAAVLVSIIARQTQNITDYRSENRPQTSDGHSFKNE